MSAPMSVSEPEIVEVKAAVRVIMTAFDDGVLVRNTDGDHQSGWAVKFMPVYAALAKLKNWSER